MTPNDALPALLQPWQNFYLLIGESAATLTGLMFVGVTFGSTLVTRENAKLFRAFIEPSYGHFVEVLFIACLMTVPMLGSTIVGALLVGVGLMRTVGLWSVFHAYREAHRRAGDVELSDWLMSIVFPVLCHLVLTGTGLALMQGSRAALLYLAPATLSLLMLGIHGAWELFVWTALAISERRDGATGADTAPVVSPEQQ